MKKSGKHLCWTEEEIEYLKSNTNKDAIEISKKINRTRKAILAKCRLLGINIKPVKNNGTALTIEKEYERRAKISASMKKNPHAGGLRKGSGRGIKGWYKGYWCDSSYELAWVIYNLEHDIKFERNWDGFKYFYKGKELTYYPDFKVKNTYYEIKGYMTEQVRTKIKQFPNNYKLIVLTGNELKYVFEYVIEKYGKNYVTLYDKSNLRVCKNCGGYIYKGNKTGYCISCFNKNKKHKENKPRKRKYKKDTCVCGNIKNVTSKLCVECTKINQRKVKRPSYEILVKEIGELGYTGTGRKYGVSDNSIRKWKKFYER